FTVSAITRIPSRASAPFLLHVRRRDQFFFCSSSAAPFRSDSLWRRDGMRGGGIFQKQTEPSKSARTAAFPCWQETHMARRRRRGAKGPRGRLLNPIPALPTSPPPGRPGGRACGSPPSRRDRARNRRSPCSLRGARGVWYAG